MASFKSIPLKSIHVGERARPVDEDHALAIAASMAERGLINPITVRSTRTPRRAKRLIHWLQVATACAGPNSTSGPRSTPSLCRPMLSRPS